MDATSTMESIFISGIDSQITESDIKGIFFDYPA